MKRRKMVLQRLLCSALCVSMVLTGQPISADPAYQTGAAEIAFSAEEYTVMENEGGYEVTLVRSGGNDREVSVAFKTADITAAYGTDYVVLDEKGKEIEVTDGVVPESGDWNLMDISSVSDEEDQKTEVSEEQEQSSGQKEEASAGGKSTGSSLLDAQKAYLNLPDETDGTETVESMLDNMNEYFQSAKGAVGVVTFDKGEKEKKISVKVIDNEKAQADRVVLFGIMGINGDENTTVEANPTAYLTIADDEEYETPVIYPESTKVTLTSTEPQARITLKRDTGVDYYTSVYVSTVQETAVEDEDYVKVEDECVAFVPGETEKIYSVSALDFDENVTYGIRIMGDDTCEVKNEYITVEIQKEESEDEENVSSMSLMAARYSGSASVTKQTTDYGWKVCAGGDDGWMNQNDGLQMHESTKNEPRGYVTTSKVNLAGINSISYTYEVGGKGSGFTTYFEIDSDQTWPGNVVGNSKNGKTGKTTESLNVKDCNDSYYIKFGNRATSAGKHNPTSHLYKPLVYNYQLYTLDTSKSLQYISRFSYDYVSGRGTKKKIAFTDGEDDYDYNPGTIHMVDSSGNTVNGFYANANTTIKPVVDSKYAEKNEKYGIELEGVYLYTKTDAELYKKDLSGDFAEHWYEYKTIWVPASGVYVDQTFVKKIIDTFGSATNIKAVPKFKQKTVQLNIHSADEENTYILNMTGSSCPNYTHWYTSNNKAYYYNKYSFPMYSKVTVRATPAKGKTLTGFRVDLWSKPDKEDPVVVGESDISTMTYTLSENMSFYPITEQQDLTISYMPGADKVLNDLTGAAYQVVDTIDANTKTISSNKNGDMTIPSVYPGMIWTVAVTPPEGYYVKWTNGTGDVKNINGKIDSSKNQSINEVNANTKKGSYDPIYGNTISSQIVQNNTKYYYEFVKEGTKTTSIVWGSVYRETSTFYDFVNGEDVETEEVPATQVSVAGTPAFTDGNGDFIIKLKGVPASGRVSVLVDDEGMTYPVTALLNYMEITLPAYQMFKPKSMSASFSKSTNKIEDENINIFDDTLTIKTGVEPNGTIVPSAVKYYIVKENGSVITCNDDKRFTIDFINNVGSIQFNPKAMMDSGDEMYVAFVDQNGKEYKKMNLGYTFIMPLNLKTFMFPLIGSTMVEETYNVATELIGDPLGDVSLGKLGFDNPETKSVYPPGLENNKNYKYSMSTYKWGDFSKAIKEFSSDDGKDDDKDKDKSEKTAEKTKDAVKDAGKEPENAGYKTNKSFSWKFSPKIAFAMQLTTRKDSAGKTRYYFEELDFLAGADFGVKSSLTIALPIGMNVIITGSLEGDVTAIYQLKTNYTGDSTWTKNAVEYSAESFGLFEEIKNVNRSVYLMLNPKITLGLGVSYAIVEVGGSATFDFDMDFKFNLDKGALGKHMYGDMTYNFDYYVKVLSFKVYSGATKTRTEPLFAVNADGHIEPDIMDGLLDADKDKSLSSVPVTREYLDNQSEWNEYANQAMNLLDITAENVNEKTVLAGAYNGSKFNLTKIDDSSILMTFIGDVAERTAVNRTGLYYSIFKDDVWSEPRLVDDDGTVDDYANAIDLGDKILVAWSSADKVFADDVTATEALTALDIKTVFFDKATKTFGTVTQVTHTTTEDYTADVEPRAAYDSETGKVLLYYTKTEYVDVDKVSELMNAPSVIAYMFYEDGKWTNADSYTEEEIEDLKNSILAWDSSLTEEEVNEQVEAYKTAWYGQRFLDTRTDTTGDMLRIVDSDAISYNGLSLYAWTVDYDGNLDTIDDRDVFLQIYNFEEASFTHIIRITQDAGIYTTPHFGRYQDNTYLFFGASGALDELEDEETNGIAYINLTETIKNGRFKLVSNGNNEYYTLGYSETDEEGNEHEIVITPSYAVTIDGYVNDFCVDVDEKERMYLTWTNNAQSKDDTRMEVFTSIYDVQVNSDETEDAEWSEAFQLTNAPSTAYSNVDAAVIGGKLYVAADKTPYVKTEENTTLDETKTDIVVLDLTPYAKPVTVENPITIDTDYVYPGVGFKLTSSVKNEGVKFIEDDVTFAFSMTTGGETTDLGTVVKEKTWRAGEVLSADVDVPALDEVADDLTFNVKITVDGKEINQSWKAVKASDVLSDNDPIVKATENGQRLTMDLRNPGNLDSDAVNVSVYVNEDGKPGKKLDQIDMETIPYNTTQNVTDEFAVADDLYTIEEGVGTLNLLVKVTYQDEEIYSYDAVATKQFDADAITILSKVMGVSVVDGDTVHAQTLDNILINLDYTGSVDPGEVQVLWESDNTDVVALSDDGTLVAAGEGIAHLEGTIVPAMQKITFDDMGNAINLYDQSLIPSYMIKKVNLTAVVTDADHVHATGDWKVTTAPTCTTDGIETSVCSICGENVTRSVAKTGHVITETVKKATTEADGAVTSSCMVCKETLDVKTIARLSTASVSKTVYAKTGKAIKPKVTVKDIQGNTISASEYTVTYSKNKNEGTAVATVIFKDTSNYAGTMKAKFSIVTKPGKASITSLTNDKNKQATVKWKKVSKATGYEIQYATNKKFSKAKTSTVKKGTTVKKAIKGLKKNKTYYVRIRTYRTVSGNTVYGRWSTVKKIKVR